MPPVTVQIQDSFGNPVAMGGVSVSVQANPVGKPIPDAAAE